MLQKLFIDSWRRQSRWLQLLQPLEWIYRAGNTLDFWSKAKLRPPRKFEVPLIVMGGITVGGAGKTPATIALARALQQRGFKVGVISRGYRGAASGNGAKAVTEVSRATKVTGVGDEPLLIACSTGCPVYTGADRYQAGLALLARHKLDLIISDDGLQHYALAGDIKLAVIDGVNGVGNQHCLPAGPLREPLQRLNQANFVLFNLANSDNLLPEQTAAALEKITQPKFMMTSKAISIVEVTADFCSDKEPQEYSIKQWLSMHKDNEIHALAGIAQPDNFFRLLERHNFNFSRTYFPNHHRFCRADLAKLGAGAIIMTEKDAVKCANFAAKQTNIWALRIHYELEEKMLQQLIALL